MTIALASIVSFSAGFLIGTLWAGGTEMTIFLAALIGCVIVIIGTMLAASRSADRLGKDDDE